MKKIAILGFLVLIMPFLGFPNDWENIIYFVLGFLIFVLSIYLSLKVRSVSVKPKERLQDNIYIENDDCSNEEEK
jgi:hypothetical protein